MEEHGIFSTLILRCAVFVRQGIIILQNLSVFDRKILFNWVGPISPREIWLFKLASREDIVLRSLEDAKRYQIGVVRKSSSANYLLKNGFSEDKNLQLANLEIQNIKKLFIGRIDLVPFNIAEMV